MQPDRQAKPGFHVTARPQPSRESSGWCPTACWCSNPGRLLLWLRQESPPPFMETHPPPPLTHVHCYPPPFPSGFRILLRSPLLPDLVCGPSGHCKSMASCTLQGGCGLTTRPPSWALGPCQALWKAGLGNSHSSVPAYSSAWFCPVLLYDSQPFHAVPCTSVLSNPGRKRR